MSDTKRFVFGVDLDGCVADFYEGLRPFAAEWRGVEIGDLPCKVTYGLPEWGITRYDDLHRFAVTQRDLFRVLKPIKGAGPALRRLSDRGVRIRVITHRLFIRHFHEETVSQTTRWLDHHGIPYWDLCFMRDKGAVDADLYVEDTERNIDALIELGQEVITFTNSTNEHRDDFKPRAYSWEDVERYVLDRLGPEWAAEGEGGEG
jgi:5'(3')-deoxyribonucleotidase